MNYENIVDLDLQKGRHLEKQGMFEDAIIFYIESFKLNPKNEETMFSIGNLYYQLNMKDQAIDSYKKVLRIKPNHFLAHLNLGVVFSSMKQFDTSIKYYQKAKGICPDIPLVYYNLGITYKQMDDFNRSIEFFKQAILLNPHYTEAHYNLGNTLELLGEVDLAIKSFEDTINSNSQHVKAHSNLGLLLTKTCQFDEAISCFEHAIGIDPEFIDAYNNLALVYMDLANFEKAILNCSIAIELNPSFVEAYSNLASIYLKMGNVENTIASYKMVLELEPDNISAQYLIDALEGKDLETAPKEYVADLFDQYSVTFDQHLVDDLGYNLPKIFRKLFDELYEGNYCFKNVLDMGCGTGLSGDAFRTVSQKLSGIDLSQKMLNLADDKNIYDYLESGELCEFLESSKEKFDLFIALEVFIYMGDLDHVFNLIQKSSNAGAYILFSTESTDMDIQYQVCKTGRYIHSNQYIKKLAAKYKFDVIRHRSTEIRKHGSDTVSGDCYILKT